MIEETFTLKSLFTINGLLLCARHCAKNFVCIISFNTESIPVRWEYNYHPPVGQKCRISNLSKVTSKFMAKLAPEAGLLTSGPALLPPHCAGGGRKWGRALK